MKKLNEKLFFTALVCGIIAVALIYYFGIKGITPIPTWGSVALAIDGTIMCGAMLIFLIRKATGAGEWDSI